MRMNLSNINSSALWILFTSLLLPFLLPKIHHSSNQPSTTARNYYLGTSREKAKLILEIKKEKARGIAK